MPGARLGDRVFLGEGTLVSAGMILANDVVAVGRPARVIRSVSATDLERLRRLRDGDLRILVASAHQIEPTVEGLDMGQLYDYRGIMPTIAPTGRCSPQPRSPE